MAFDKLDLNLTADDMAELAASYGDMNVPPVSLSRVTDLAHTQTYYEANFVRCANDFSISL